MMATLTMLVKYASDIGIALPEIMFWRQAVTIPVVLLGLWATSGLARLRTDRLRSHGLRALTGMFAAFGAPLMGLFLPFFISAHTPWQWTVLIALGLVGTAGQFLLSASLRYGAVVSVLIMDYTALIWATLYGWLVWDRLPPTAMWIGAPLIILAGMIIVWRERLRAQRISPTSSLEAD